LETKMSYLLDRKMQKKTFMRIAMGATVLLILFFFRSSIGSVFSALSHTVFRPVFIVGNNIGGKFGSLGAYFVSKNSLYSENQDLKTKLAENSARMVNYDSVLAENASLKEILGRKNEATPMILAAILAKPNKSPYDTLVIDAGEKQGLEKGDVVFALGNVPIGHVDSVYVNTSKVILFSNSGEKTQVVMGGELDRPLGTGENVFLEAVGRGGGNFEIILPRDFTPVKGDEVVLPGITPYVLGIVETIISDPRDPFIKALLVSPVNIQELQFVEVKI